MPHIEHKHVEEISTDPLGNQTVEAISTVTTKTHVNSDTMNTGYTHTEVRAPIIHPTNAISVASMSGLANQLVGEGMTSTVERVTAGARDEQIYESPELAEERYKHQEKYFKEKEKIREKHEREMEKLTEDYRRKTEKEAEKIRKEMEKQHEVDVEYRERLVEDAIKRQKEELELEAKYAKKELERQRELAMDALENSRVHTNINVKMGTAAGITVSGSGADHRVEVTQDHHHQGMGSKIKETLTGKP